VDLDDVHLFHGRCRNLIQEAAAGGLENARIGKASAPKHAEGNRRRADCGMQIVAGDKPMSG
jgi:hypothetical protein